MLLSCQAGRPARPAGPQGGIMLITVISNSNSNIDD